MPKLPSSWSTTWIRWKQKLSEKLSVFQSFFQRKVLEKAKDIGKPSKEGSASSQKSAQRERKHWLLDKNFRPQLDHYSKWALGIIGIHFLAASTMILLEFLLPEPSAPRPIPSHMTGAMSSSKDVSTEILASKNIFHRQDKIPPLGSQGQENQGSGGDSQVCVKEDSSPSNTPLQLIGTIVMENPKRSIATFSGGGPEDIHVLRQGETLEGQIRVDHIKRLSVAFKNLRNNRCEFLEIKVDPDMLTRGSMPGATDRVAPSRSGTDVRSGIKKEGENQYTIDRSVIETFRENPQDILQQALAVPINGPDGGLEAFRIEQVQPDSPFEALGVQPGDKITGVNGSGFRDMGQVFQMFENIDELRQLDVQIERGGQSITLNYTIP